MCLLIFRSYCSQLGDQQLVVLKIKECLQRKEFKHFSGTTEHDEIEYDISIRSGTGTLKQDLERDREHTGGLGATRGKRGVH